ncbi:MAG: choice-of-anchor Q domain-containing protein [Chthoniobacterales bacterium]
MFAGSPVRSPFWVAAISVLILGSAQAATVTVTRLDDRNVGCNAGDCSLREAIALANTQAGDDTIAFSVPTPATISLVNGNIAITSNIVVNGPGINFLTVDGNNLDHIFSIGLGAVVTINNLTLTHGAGAIDGKANQLTVDTVRFVDNVGPSTIGGGIYSSVGALTVLNCTFTDNQAQTGGAIYHSGAQLKVQSSTFSGNISTRTADPNGGGAIYTEQTSIISNSTFSGNSSGYAGGGVFYLGAGTKTLTVRNCTFTGNSAGKYGGGLIHLADGGGKVANNIISGNSAPQYADYYDGGSITLVTNLVGGNPMLGPLLDRGGVTPTHGLLSGSPALNAGTNAEALDINGAALTTDQRGAGFPRILSGTVDLGAYEGTIPANLPPVNSVPGAQVMNEDSVLTFSSGNGNLIFVSDSDAHTNPVQVTLTATNGALTLSGTYRLSFTAGDGNSDSVMTFTGALTDINSALNTMVFTPNANFAGAAAIQIATNDLGNTGTGGALQDSDSINITVNPGNDPPINVVPGPQSVVSGSVLTFSPGNGNAISVSDIDAGANPVAVTLSAINGTLTLSTTSGLSFGNGDGSSDASMSFTGSLPSINAALNGLQFSPNPGVTGAASLQIVSNDQGNTGSGGALSDNDTINININPPPPSPTPTPPPVGQLANIATRLRVQTDPNVLFGGFIITGNQPKTIIIRAIGPSLPLSGALANPVLELHDSSSALVAENDNWVDAPNKQAIIDSTIPPPNDLESAILTTLSPGTYTAILRGVGGTSGIGVVEIYDLSSNSDSKLANISTRGFVDTGDNILIGGLIVVGQNSVKVIVRAIGPSLPFEGVLADPTLELHDGNGALLAFDDDWRTGGQEAEINATTIPPSNDAESAIVRDLTPGNYTAVLRGKNDTTGIGVIEVYALQ